MQTLSLETIKLIHDHLTQYFTRSNDPISPPGVRSDQLLESAVNKQHAGFADYLQYETPLRNAAALMYGLCLNHPFHNGNKRTALLSGIMHLDGNGISFTSKVKRDDLYKLMLGIAGEGGSIVGGLRRSTRATRRNQDLEIDEIDRWLADRTRRIEKGEKRNITFAQLYKLIDSFEHLKIGSNRKGNYLEVFEKRKRMLGGEKWSVVYKIPCPGDGRTVPVQEIKDARKALGLDEEHGVDSYSFYGTQTVIDGFIRDHRKVLRRLAHT